MQLKISKFLLFWLMLIILCFSYATGARKKVENVMHPTIFFIFSARENEKFKGMQIIDHRLANIINSSSLRGQS